MPTGGADDGLPQVARPALGDRSAKSMTEATPSARADHAATRTPREHERRGWAEVLGRWQGVVAFSLCLTFLACRYSPALSVPEFGLLDVWMRSRPARKPDPRIVIVAVERGDIELFQQAREARHPECACATVCRSDIGRALLRIKQAGARVVAVDITFSHACPVGQGTPLAHDRMLTRALSMPGETVVVAEPNPNPDRLFFTDPPVRMLGIPGPAIASPVLYNPHGVIRGVQLLQQDSPSRVDRQQLPQLSLVGRSYPALSAAAYCAYQGQPSNMPDPVGDDAVRLPWREVPVWASESIYLFRPIMPVEPELSKHAMLIDWVGPVGTFPMYSLGEVVSQSDRLLRSRFAGRIVLVGSAADRKYCPMVGFPSPPEWPLLDQSGERTMSGVEIHANALQTLLRGTFIRPIGIPFAWGLIFLCCLTAAVAVTSLRAWIATAALALEIAALHGLSYALIRHDYWLYAVIPSAAALVSGVVTAMWGYARARQRAATLTTEAEARDAATESLVHDLKQPLSAISALAAALRAQQQSGRGMPASPELLQRIQQQVQAALGDIDELLATSPHRLIELRRQEFDLAAVARDLAVAQSMRSPLHEVEVRAPDEGVLVNGDPRYLARVLNNLMDNAIKYWPEGGTVVVELEATADEVAAHVIDHGLGMSPEQQSRVFARFGRALPPGVEIPGSGIGLYSVKRIVERHGGVVEVESEPGRGSVFTVRVPRG